MKIEPLLVDDAVLERLGGRLAAARLVKNWTQVDLAQKAGVSTSTIARLEAGAVSTQLSSFIRVCRALGLLERLDLLVPEPQPSPIEQLKLQGRQRKRASGKKATPAPRKPWTWGEP